MKRTLLFLIILLYQGYKYEGENVRVLTDFNPDLSLTAPETCRLLNSSGLTVHRAVERVVLHGSRGPSGTHRVDSDRDLPLLVKVPEGMNDNAADPFLREVLFTTLSAWTGFVELDLAAVYDMSGCGLTCFERRSYDPETLDKACTKQNCFGLYKIQKGYRGFVRDEDMNIREMYPCMVIWRLGNQGY